MQNSASYNYRSIYSRIKLKSFEYEKAYTLHVQERFQESQNILEKLIFTALKNKQGESSGVNLKDGILLYAWNLQQLQKYDECRRWIYDARESGYVDPVDTETILIELWIDWANGSYSQIIEQADELVSRYSQNLHPILSEFLFLRGSTYAKLGNIDDALNDCEAAYILFKLLKKLKEQAIAANALGFLFWRRSQYSESLTWLKRSLDINVKLKLEKRIGVNHLNIGIAYYKIGNYSHSLRELHQSINLLEEVCADSDLCRAKIALGNVCRLRCDYAAARQNLMTAYTLATKQRIPREECLALEFLGDVFRDEGKPGEALRYYARGLAIAKRIAPEGDLVMELLRREGECNELLDKIAEALTILARARTMAQNLGDRFEEGVILRCMAVCVAKVSDWNSARQYITESLQILTDVDAQHELAIAHLRSAQIISEQACDPQQGTSTVVLLEQAWDDTLAAQHLFLKLGIDEWLQMTKQLFSTISKQRVSAAKQISEVERESFTPPDKSTIIAVSEPMRSVLHLCDTFARCDEAVLITGDTGTGKELVARRIHEKSHRRDEQFVAVNASAIPATMFEREFFGHHRGAFSGADRDSPGYAIQADGGTLFLDEIAEMPLGLQPKLLRLLQEGTFTSLGNPELKHTDVRLVAATNAKLQEIVETGKFRKDLFYRMRVLEIDIPPLKQRIADIVPLLNHFLSMSAGRTATVSEFFDEGSILAMQRYRWPGNVREVATVAYRAHIMMAVEGRVRVMVGLEPDVLLLTGPNQMAHAAASGSAEEDIMRSRIMILLEETDNNRSATARRLGISRTTLYRWMNRLGLHR